MTTRHGGADRVSTKAKLADELVILGGVIAAAREAAGRKQSEIAGALGLPASYLSKVESGTRRLDVIEFLRIADAIGIDPAKLILAVKTQLGEPSITYDGSHA